MGVTFMGNSPNPKSEKLKREASVPKSPDKEDIVQLGFEKRGMVDWFSPSQLAQTGFKAFVSAIFGNYADNRELQAALARNQELDGIIDYSDRQTIWLDYVSDLGSGWNSSYSIAYLLGRKKINVTDSEGEKYRLPRGNILVMGGDEVYPTATWKEYNDRLSAPYRCSLPYISGEDDAPSLFAIPGNHDWYDGLSSFLKLFCQGRWIGGWNTKQTRSYFAVKLPSNCWLWGIDIQLRADIDKPQLDYFDEVYRRADDGDTVILCTAEPVWVYQEYERDDKPFKNLDFFEKRYSTNRNKKLTFRLMLTGDMHHYTSFREENTTNPKWKITAGGGGAFLHPTHQVPDSLHLNGIEYKKSAASPDSDTSRKLAWNTLRFPFINKKFGAFFAVIYLLFTWGATVSHQVPGSSSVSFIFELSQYSVSQLGTVFTLYKQVLFFNPLLSVLLLLVFVGFLSFTDRNRKKATGCWVLGAFHGFMQILLILISVWITAVLLVRVLVVPSSGMSVIIAGVIITTVLGWLFSGYAMGLYLFVAVLLLKTHETEAFSSFRSTSFKNFIRMKIDRKEIKIYPITVPEACTEWKFKGGVRGENPWYEPQNDLRYELIENPVVIKKL